MDQVSDMEAPNMDQEPVVNQAPGVEIPNMDQETNIFLETNGSRNIPIVLYQVPDNSDIEGATGANASMILNSSIGSSHQQSNIINTKSSSETIPMAPKKTSKDDRRIIIDINADDFLCVVCMSNFAKSPLNICSKGHLMCFKCTVILMTYHMKGEGSANCPTCRAPITPSPTTPIFRDINEKVQKAVMKKAKQLFDKENNGASGSNELVMVKKEIMRVGVASELRNCKSRICKRESKCKLIQESAPYSPVRINVSSHRIRIWAKELMNLDEFTMQFVTHRDKFTASHAFDEFQTWCIDEKFPPYKDLTIGTMTKEMYAMSLWSYVTFLSTAGESFNSFLFNRRQTRMERYSPDQWLVIAERIIGESYCLGSKRQRLRF